MKLVIFLNIVKTFWGGADKYTQKRMISFYFSGSIPGKGQFKEGDLK